MMTALREKVEMTHVIILTVTGIGMDHCLDSNNDRHTFKLWFIHAIKQLLMYNLGAQIVKFKFSSCQTIF